MTDTESSKTWITSKTIAIAARIPHDLHDQIEGYGLDNFPKGEGKYDKTATIIDLISKGLGLDGVSQSVKQSVNQLEVEQIVKQAVTQEMIDTVKQIVMQDVKQDLLSSISQSVKQEDKQSVKQDILEDVKLIVKQSVKQDEKSLESAITNHPTIQSMKTHIESLDSYLDGLTKAIKDMKEVEERQKPKKPGKTAKTRLNQEELDHALSVKDEYALLDLPLTGKFGKRELIKDLIPQATWIKDRFLELEKKHPPKRRPNGQKQSFNYSHLTTTQADEIIKEFCLR